LDRLIFSDLQILYNLYYERVAEEKKIAEEKRVTEEKRKFVHTRRHAIFKPNLNVFNIYSRCTIQGV